MALRYQGSQPDLLVSCLGGSVSVLVGAYAQYRNRVLNAVGEHTIPRGLHARATSLPVRKHAGVLVNAETTPG